MSVISVDTELLNLQSGRVRSTMERISADIRAMNQGLTALQGSWRGSASTGFQSLVTEWPPRRTEWRRRWRPSPRRWLRPPRSTGTSNW